MIFIIPCLYYFYLILGRIPNGESKLSSSKREKTEVDFDDAFVQELMEKIEALTTEKSEISHQFLQEKSLREESNRKVNISNIC